MNWLASASIALTSLLMLGCTSSPPADSFRAGWYLARPQKSEHSEIVYVALLNQSKQEQLIRNVYLNSPPNNPEKGARLNSQDSFIPLKPGGLLVRPVTDFAQFPEKCRLPISVAVQTQLEDRSIFLQEIEIIGLMPSLLPEGWEACPLDTKKTE